jgi:hypothetical protein
MAAVQDWDGLLWFNYNPGRQPETAIDDPFDVNAVPAKIVQVATASSLFRGGWVDAARGLLPLWYGGGLGQEALIQGRSPVPYTVYEPATLLSQRVRIDVGAAPSAMVPGAPVEGVGWWSDPGLLVLDRPLIQARVGPPEPATDRGAGARSPSRLRVAGQGWAAVALASADGLPLATGRRSLLTIGTRVQNTGMLWSTDGRYVRNWGSGPPRVEAFVGTIEIYAEQRPRVSRLGVDGSVGAELPVKALGQGWYRLSLDATVDCPWFLVEKAGG